MFDDMMDKLVLSIIIYLAVIDCDRNESTEPASKLFRLHKTFIGLEANDFAESTVFIPSFSVIYCFCNAVSIMGYDGLDRIVLKKSNQDLNYIQSLGDAYTIFHS